MQIFRYAEQGSIELLWISATNPAVSLPDLARIRAILARQELFVVVQDVFLTETAEFADVVLPAATWGEKTGTFTNADRTVHLSEKAVEPPGEARPDLDIFLDYARRMDFRDNDGEPLIKWTRPRGRVRGVEGVLARAGPATTPGSPTSSCAAASGIQWPCTRRPRRHRAALHRRRVQHRSGRTARRYGHDLAHRRRQHRARVPGQGARAVARSCTPPSTSRRPRRPTDEYPLLLTTGRTVYHFHTRTKTGRAPSSTPPRPTSGSSSARTTPRRSASTRATSSRRVRRAARSRRRRGSAASGAASSSCRSTTATGTATTRRTRAANELTLTAWDPVSKQPLFKVAAVRVARVGED